LALLLPAGGLVALKQKLSGRRQEFGEQLTDSLQVLASAIRAGQSMAGALAVVVGESAEPTRTEFRRIVADEQLGVPLDEAIRSVAERMKSRDLEQVALVAAIQREAGGNTAEVLDQVIGTIRERAELRRKIRALTAQGRMSRWIVSLLPLALLLVLMLLSPGYLDPLFHTTTGQILLGVGGLLTVAGSFVIGRIVNIEV
jgi:tight adherence protein B